MKRPYKKAKLGPHQYSLRLQVHRDPVIAPPAKAYLVYRGGRWCLYRNKWKSKFRDGAAITGTTIPEVMQRLAKAYNNHRYGVHHGRRQAL